MSSAFQGAQVLVTGGMGFIGSNLAVRLLEAGAQVTVLDGMHPDYGGNIENLRPTDGLTINISDVRDQSSLRYLVQGKDFIFNLAGQTSHVGSMQQPFDDLAINATAQLGLLELCRELNPGVKVVFTSTRQLYGAPRYLPVDERHPVCPVDVNGINKQAGEWYHLLYHQVYGIRATVLRLTNTYGPRLRIKDARQTFVGVWVRQLLRQQPFEVWGGAQLRDFTYVDDCVEALLLAAASPRADGQVYNLGGDRPVSLLELADIIVAANGGEGQYSIHEFPAERKRIDIGDFYADYRKITDELGWTPRVPLEDGLRRTLEYFRPRMTHYL